MNSPLKNPYYRMTALAVACIFGAMHWAYWSAADVLPAGYRLKFFTAACCAAAAVAFAGWILGRRFQRRLDRLAQGNAAGSEFVPASDELSQLDRRVSGMARDLEARVAELEREKTRLDAMLRSMREGLIVIGHDRTVLLMNPAAEKILGVNASRAAGRNLLEAVRNTDLVALVGEAFGQDAGLSRQIRFFNPEESHLLVNVAPYRIGSGERQAALVLHDVTEIHRLENLRREFVANVSHELKTPLTSLQGFIETLLAGAWQKPDHAKRFLGMMDEDAKRLSRLIHDLLDLSRIESGGGPDRREAVDLGVLAAGALSRLQTLTAQKKLAVHNALTPGTLTTIGDAGQLEQVFVNLLENAVKFTPEGGRIDLRGSRTPDGIRVEIADTGAGIPEAALARVFERFYRVDPARSREMGGTGLGLSIVKHIVEQHGGSVAVSSPGPGLGSVFSFLLPLRG